MAARYCHVYQLMTFIFSYSVSNTESGSVTMLWRKEWKLPRRADPLRDVAQHVDFFFTFELLNALLVVNSVTKTRFRQDGN